MAWLRTCTDTDSSACLPYDDDSFYFRRSGAKHWRLYGGWLERGFFPVDYRLRYFRKGLCAPLG